MVTMTIILNRIFGDNDFNLYAYSGPFRAGLKSIRLTKGGNEVWVYYPVDKADYDKNQHKRRRWLDPVYER